jgi:hypothetical protein
MTHNQTGQAGAEELQKLLLHYLRAWDAGVPVGEAAFDACVNLPEFAQFLAAKASALLPSGAGR